MKNTIRLFDQDSHLYTFSATVLACDEIESGNFRVVLDRTAFFPEGGGQAADVGTLAGQPVLDVQEECGVIYHTVTRPLPVDETVDGCLDADVRLRRMQNHTGEHIVSGLIHAAYGFDNVGFHLGSEDVTLDFNGVLDRTQLDEIEDKANRIVAACLPIKAYYPAPDLLSNMIYRSKLELYENVRIVEIGDGGSVDRCACCAPHVSNTGEVGIIKLLDFIHYKGGIRIHMHCGLDALEDYRRRYTAIASMASEMSVKQADVAEGFARMQADIAEKKQIINSLREQLLDMKADALQPVENSLCLFEEDLDAVGMRRLLNRVTGKCGALCGVFVGNDESGCGYRFVIGRADPSIDLRARAKELNTALRARGGGSSEMLQGQSACTREEIERVFEAL